MNLRAPRSSSQRDEGDLYAAHTIQVGPVALRQGNRVLFPLVSKSKSP